MRIQEVGGIFHVTARGVRRGIVFVDEFDYELYLRLLEMSMRVG